MSNAPRTYSGTLNKRPRRRKRTPGATAPIMLALFVLGFLYLAWTTRDTYPVERLLPAKTAYHFTANKLLDNRMELAASRVWQAMPPALRAGEIQQVLSRNLGMPEWILNNLFPDTCYFAGDDLKGFSDALLLSRMSRTGCVIERIYRWLPGVTEDWAGGLYLRRVRGTDFYYAVRGRALAVSRSRDNLVRALTLLREDSVPRDVLAKEQSEYGAEHFWGSIALSPDDALGAAFESAGFVLRVEQDSALLRLRATLRPEFQQRFAEKVAAIKPGPLIAPPTGMMELSTNLAMPLRELWQFAGELSNNVETMDGLWQKWAVAENDTAQEALPAAVTSLLGPLGPGLRLAWRGFDLNEMFPMPDIVATIDAEAELLATACSHLPPMDQAQPWDMTLRYDAVTARLHLPLFGGPSMEPTAGAYANTLLIASSRLVAEEYLAATPALEPLPEQGNLYLRLRPGQCAKALMDAGALLAEAQLIRNHTPASLMETAKPWMDEAGAIDAVTLVAGLENQDVSAQVRVECAAPPAK